MMIMGTSPLGPVLFVAVVFIAATVMCTALQHMLAYLKIVRAKRSREHLVWGVVGGLMITFLFVMLKCNTFF